MKLYEKKGWKHPKKGKFGVEIEVESSRVNFCGILTPSGWSTTEDHSLRNAYNLEYVFLRPYSYKTSVEKIEQLQEVFDVEGDATQTPSIRTGVHVHLNVTDYTASQLARIVLVYMSMERVLTRYCGEDRTGNLFCLRVCDCPSMVSLVKGCMESGDWFSSIPQDTYKYSALNLSTLSKHGSLEFRALRTPQRLSGIVEWLDIISAIEEYALKLESLQTIPYDMSYYSPDTWVRKVLGEELFKKVQYDEMDKDVRADMRNIQVLYHTEVKEFSNDY